MATPTLSLSTANLFVGMPSPLSFSGPRLFRKIYTSVKLGFLSTIWKLSSPQKPYLQFIQTAYRVSQSKDKALVLSLKTCLCTHLCAPKDSAQSIHIPDGKTETNETLIKPPIGSRIHFFNISDDCISKDHSSVDELLDTQHHSASH